MIAAASRAAMSGRQSVRVAGDVSQDGAPATLDVVASPERCLGSVTTGGLTIEMLKIRDTTWIRPDAAFWRQTMGDRADLVIAAAGETWVHFPEDLGFERFCDFEDMPGADPGEETEVGGVSRGRRHEHRPRGGGDRGLVYSDFDAPIDARRRPRPTPSSTSARSSDRQGTST